MHFGFYFVCKREFSERFHAKFSCKSDDVSVKVLFCFSLLNQYIQFAIVDASKLLCLFVDIFRNLLTPIFTRVRHTFEFFYFLLHLNV